MVEGGVGMDQSWAPPQNACGLPGTILANGLHFYPSVACWPRPQMKSSSSWTLDPRKKVRSAFGGLV